MGSRNQTGKQSRKLLTTKSRGIGRNILTNSFSYSVGGERAIDSALRRVWKAAERTQQHGAVKVLFKDGKPVTNETA